MCKQALATEFIKYNFLKMLQTYLKDFYIYMQMRRLFSFVEQVFLIQQVFQTLKVWLINSKKNLVIISIQFKMPPINLDNSTPRLGC